MYKKVDTDMNFVDRGEKETVQFWKRKQHFQESIDEREGSRLICFTTDRPLRTENRISGM